LQTVPWSILIAQYKPRAMSPVRFFFTSTCCFSTSREWIVFVVTIGLSALVRKDFRTTAVVAAEELPIVAQLRLVIWL
jgi:hypothetical protein